MTRQTHAAAGFAGGLFLAQTQPLDAALILAGLTMVAAVLPDIDLALGIEHRTITHSLLALLAVALVCWRFVPAPAGGLFVFGYASHLVLDSLTPRGVPWLYPLKWRLRTLNITTGSLLDRLLGAALAIAVIPLIGAKVNLWLIWFQFFG